MKKYRVHITEQASNQLSQIYEYIAFELLEPSYAAKQVENLTSKILSLDTTPKRCKIFSYTLYPGQDVVAYWWIIILFFSLSTIPW